MTEATAAAKPDKRSTRVDDLIYKIQVELAHITARLDTVLSFRGDFRRENEEFKRYLEREVAKLESRTEAALKELAARINQEQEEIEELKLTDTKHTGYFASAAFIRDLLQAAILTVLATGVFFR
jgi:molecular chaperone GrpE (heat shock protein)